MRRSTLAAVLLGMLASRPALAEDTVQGLRAEISRAEQLLHSLNARLDALERQQQGEAGTPPAHPVGPPPRDTVADPMTAAARPEDELPYTRPAATPALPAVATGTPPGYHSVLPPRDSVADPSLAAPRADDTVSPTDPELRGFFVIPGTETMIRLGGYAKLDAIVDARQAGEQDQFITSTIPVGSVNRDTANVGMHAKQTRFSFEARRPTTRGNLRFYLENDFFGSSDGYQFRLRHAYGQLGNTYAGYGYSSFMDPDSLPDTLDFAGPGGAAYLMAAGMRHIFRLGEGTTLAIAAEDPESELAVDRDDVIAVDRVPDFSLVARMEREWGHVQLGAVARSLAYSSNGTKERALGGGLSLSGSVSLPERDLLLFGLLGGKGISRYTADLTGSGLDAGIADDGALEALPIFGGFVGYTHYWSQDWRSNLVYGELHLDDEGVLASEAFRRSRYGALNLIWSPAPTWTMGMELLYGELQQQDGRSADAMRMQGSLQYNFIK